MNWVFRNGICPDNRDTSVHRHFIPMSEYKRQFILNKKTSQLIYIELRVKLNKRPGWEKRTSIIH